MQEFEELKKKLAFGCMRLPMIGEDVDVEQFKHMVDLFLDRGFNYFDTAHGYISGKSELAIKECLTSRYPRDKYLLTNKLTGFFFHNEEEVLPLFQSQLEACGVDYFDFYLMHAQNRDIFEHFKRCRAYEQAIQLRNEGKIKHLGISFHDTADILDRILSEYPEIEVVQLQFNYLDYEDVTVQSRLCYEVCEKHDKRVLIMEPIKGGTLIKLPGMAKDILEESGLSPANLAVRFAASFPRVMMVLSGMSTLEQMDENTTFMQDFKPLNDDEFKLTQKIAEAIRDESLISCTGCRYCVDGCPMHILIPDLFSNLNSKRHFDDKTADDRYNNELVIDHGKASACIRCGKCEKSCPQHLPIRTLLVEVAKEFEK